jgi:aryl-alcohol dehydrogenase-like predicted oxidoreductase
MGVAGAAIGSHVVGGEPFRAPAGTMPTRVLGKTGVRVGALALGSVGAPVDFPSDEQAVEFIRACIDAGITYFDTGPTYGHEGDSRSAERRIGKAIAGRRKEVFVATKTGHRDADAAMRDIETSLKLLGADYLDSVQIHGVRPQDRVARWGKEDGVYTLLARLKEQKVIRFVGLTGHVPAILKEAVETYPFDTILMTLNPAPARREFEDLLFPVIQKQNLGRIAMKIMGGSRQYGRTATEGLPARLVGTAKGLVTAEALLRYALALPVHTATCGIADYRQLHQNLAVCCGLKPMNGDERKTLERAMEGLSMTRAYPHPVYTEA